MLTLAGGSTDIVAASDRNRTISLYTVNAKETLTIQYMKDGKHIPEAIDKINWLLRDWRRDEKAKMDPAIIDLVWEIHNELGSKEPVHVISAYRSRATNDMLRRTVGGQASESRHILGKAMDVMFPDVPLKRLRYAGLVHERGGVGYYPTSGIPFVHLDTDRVRAWPRASRQELALLFPNGRTQHVAADGGAISPGDVRTAMANTELASEISDLRRQMTEPKPPVQMASLVPPMPKLLSAPKPIERPMALGNRGPTDEERARMAALSAPAAAQPKLMAEPAPIQRAAARADVAVPSEFTKPAPQKKLAAADPRTPRCQTHAGLRRRPAAGHGVHRAAGLRRRALRRAVVQHVPGGSTAHPDVLEGRCRAGAPDPSVRQGTQSRDDDREFHRWRDGSGEQDRRYAQHPGRRAQQIAPHAGLPPLAAHTASIVLRSSAGTRHPLGAAAARRELADLAQLALGRGHIVRLPRAYERLGVVAPREVMVIARDDRPDRHMRLGTGIEVHDPRVRAAPLDQHGSAPLMRG
jgi:uncharacterized protein YcbK (DUF882 family)